jgi:hypothetical protein
VLTVLGAFWTVASIAFVSNPSDRVDTAAGAVNLAFALLLLLLPGLYLAVTGFRRRAHRERVERVAALGAVAARLPIAEVAAHTRVSEAEARGLLLDAVTAGVLRGRIDVEHGVFLSADADPSAGPREVACRRCGGSTTVVALAGAALACPFCGASI